MMEMQLLLSENNLDIPSKLYTDVPYITNTRERSFTYPVSDGSNLYLYGGYPGSGGSVESSLRKYSPITKTWVDISSNMRNAYATGIYVEGSLYFYGGSTSFSPSNGSNIINRFEKYNIATNT